MLSDFFTLFFRIFPRLKSIMWREAYQFLSRVYRKSDWKFMNYGFSPVDDGADQLYLSREDEVDRYCIQLYHFLAKTVQLKGKHVLEIGSGRGGGADYIMRYLNPKSVLGIDFSKNAVAFCNRHYRRNGLSFETGNAESLPCPKNRFDVVINIESSHCYNSMDGFLEEVKRVLTPGGYFLFADFRARKELATLKEQIQRSGMTTINEADITTNVLEALRRDHERKSTEIRTIIATMLKLNGDRPEAGIKTAIQKLLVRFILEFSGGRGSTIYNEFGRRDTIYVGYVLRKPSPASN